VAEDALRGFLRNLSAIRLHLRTVEEASQVA
jgi:hypothetical protein